MANLGLLGINPNTVEQEIFMAGNFHDRKISRNRGVRRLLIGIGINNVNLIFIEPYRSA